MAKKKSNSGQGPITLLKRYMVEAGWRLKEESSIADVVVVIVATTGKNGRTYIEYGSANPAAVRGVVDAAYEAEFNEPIIIEIEAETGEDGEFDGDVEETD